MEKRINAFVKRYFTGEELIIYQYGLLVGCQFIIFLVFTVIIGISLGMLIESVIFLLTFYSIRSYIGGVHLSKYKWCLLLSCTIVAVLLVTVKYTNLKNFYGITLFMCMMIYIYIICNSKCYDPKNFEKCYFIKKIKTNAAKVVCLYVFFLTIDYRNGLEIIVYTLVTVILAKMIGKKKMENL